MAPQFVDISAFQPTQIDWGAYAAWARQWDGTARVAMRSSYGVGFTDQHFAAYRQGAISAGVDIIYYYHYGYPQYNNPFDEAHAAYSTIGSIRPQDMVMLDFEENVDAATADWAYGWLRATEEIYQGKFPGLYASSAYIAQKLQDTRLAKYPLWLANWQHTPDERPACPAPWTSYEFVQYTDKATNIPGIAGNVDCNIFLGGNTSMIPQGWADDGQALTAPNGHKVVLGFRDYILKNPWDPNNVPLEEEYHADPVEDYYDQPGANAGQRQMFLYSELVYTPQRGVYVPGIGMELLGARRDRDQARQDLATALAQVDTGLVAKVHAFRDAWANLESV